MKILQVNVVYKRGSTGKIVHDIHRYLQDKGVESIVCYGRGPKKNEKYAYKVSSEALARFNALRSRITGLQYNGSLISTGRLIRIIKDENPDIVHLHCLNGHFVNIYSLLDFLKKIHMKTVVTLHAEFMHTGSCSHAYECNKWRSGCGRCPRLRNATKSYWYDRTGEAWLRMKEAFEGFEHLKIIAVSKWLEDRAKESPIMSKYPFSVVHNGIDTERLFRPRDFKHLQTKFGLSNKKIILHVTASFTLSDTDVKGGKYIVKLAEQINDENVKILVIGGRDLSLSLPDNIINVGRINNQEELAAYYSMANLTVVTSKRETFSMVCAESLSCGTPVVGFMAGGPETIALREYSEFVDYGNMNQLCTTISKWINEKNSIYSNEISRKAREHYCSSNMGYKYLEVYNELMESSNDHV